ncbi:LuxR C-terminal-related transcriptional regulator [Streptomyces sp. NPDC059637]|uniref:helix-turn-helix transcriptional regulator n=1 Tax=Streptomyces sp. NPDC059637 TaxID=3347752 RepID=UPI0036BCC4BC
MSETGDIRAALLALRRTSGLPVAFGGAVAGSGAGTGTGAGRLRIGELSGAATGALRGLAVTAGNGLGGKAVALSRPFAVSDYPASAAISHEYDAAVGAEGLRAVLAVPVVVGRTVRAVLYGALREPLALGDRTLDAAVAVARDLEQTLAVRDAERRLLARRPSAPGPGTGSGPDCGTDGGPGTGRAAAAAWEEVRGAHGELRALARAADDPLLRARLEAVCARLASAAGGSTGGDARAADGTGTAQAAPAAPAAPLSPRELDVLVCVASGATNGAAAAALGLRPETVKSYLRSAMRKLGAHTRLEAVVAARRAGLLP